MGFFTPTFNKTQIEQAITQLELQSASELRVYIERKMPKGVNSPIQRARTIFQQLEMHHTIARNGVLLYLAHQDKQCAIIGDIAVDLVVPRDYWQMQCDLMIAQFKQKQFTQGIVQTIERMTPLLSTHFPITQNDQNELPNEVIIND